jgi:hypothetical protein
MRASSTLALVLAAGLAVPAAAADLGVAVVREAPAAGILGFSDLPLCDDPAVLGKIVDKQHWAEENTWQDGVRIAAIGDIRQRYGTTKFVSDIEHRHCQADADLGPGNRPDRLYYVISARQGFASIGWGVDFCMPRHDPYRVYDADCRVLK